MAAVGTLVSIRHGAGDTEGATRLTQAGLWLAWGMALVAALLLWNLEPILLQFGQAEANVHMAAQFLITLPFALPGLLSFMALRGFTSALGRAGPVMTISLAGAAANFVLNYALIHQWLGLPNLGLMGIGLVTAIVTNCMALALALHIRRHPAYAAYPIRKGLSKLSRSHLGELWRLGLPIGGTYAVEVGLFTLRRSAWARWAARRWRRTRSPCRPCPWRSWFRWGCPTRSPCVSASIMEQATC